MIIELVALENDSSVPLCVLAKSSWRNLLQSKIVGWYFGCCTGAKMRHATINIHYLIIISRCILGGRIYLTKYKHCGLPSGVVWFQGDVNSGGWGRDTVWILGAVLTRAATPYKRSPQASHHTAEELPTTALFLYY